MADFKVAEIPTNGTGRGSHRWQGLQQQLLASLGKSIVLDTGNARECDVAYQTTSQWLRRNHPELILRRRTLPDGVYLWLEKRAEVELESGRQR